jgi:hypothetical protein
MTYCIRMKARHLTAALALVGMMLFVPGWTPAYGDSAQVSNLLQQARASAIQLKADSNEMETYSQNQLHWTTHARQINRVKEHVNNSGKILADLHAAREGAEPWQQDVIDKITPLLQEMASHTESIISHLNDRRQTWHPEYHGYLQSNSRLADDLSKLIGDYIDYGQAKSKTDSLGKSLGFAQSQGASAE